jgi:hypothetical protein
LTSAVDAYFIPIFFTVGALRANRTLSTTVYPNLSSVLIPKAVLTVVALYTLRASTIYFFLTIVEYSVITVWWNFITFIQATGHKKTGRKDCHKHNNVGTESHSKMEYQVSKI